jgi:threonine dehydrogenase-like Zn-dependent dehydrogenase
MRAVCWGGPHRLSVEEVVEPRIAHARDAIVRMRLATLSGADLHVCGGHLPGMAVGDVIGREFMGEVVDLGLGVSGLRPGDRVVVSPLLGCGACPACARGEQALCDNSNPHPEQLEGLYGRASAAVLGQGRAFGGHAGALAEYVRVPFADVNCLRVPEGVTDEQALLASDTLPVAWAAASECRLTGGEILAVWGAGAVGLMAVAAARSMGVERALVIDHVPERLDLAAAFGAEPIDHLEVEVVEALFELTGGRGPDACIDAVGMEAEDTGVEALYDRVKQALRLESDRPTALRQTIHAARKGGAISIAGLYGGMVDKFPLGAAMHKGLTLRMAQPHAQRVVPRIMELLATGRLDTAPLITHRMSLADAPEAYELFRHRAEGCVRVALRP